MTRAGLFGLMVLLLGGFAGLFCARPAGAEPPPEVLVIVVPHGWAEVERIIGCESRWVADARNGDHVGLLQLSRIHEWRFVAHGWTWADAEDPVKNLAVGAELWMEQGNTPWKSSRSCWGAL